MPQRIGRRTVAVSAAVLGYASVVGKKEGEGPLRHEFDYISEDTSFGEKTWEKAESRIQKETLDRALSKAGVTSDAVDIVFAGDLLNQCISTSFGLREAGIPLVGLFGACSTMTEALSLASIFVDSGAANTAAAVTSSHFCSAERQFRYPLEYGAQRAPGAQWTVTGGGAVVLGRDGPGPFIRHVTIGRIEDLGVKDASNMGAAMAPAAASTLLAYFQDTGTQPKDYDLIASGDLGQVGGELLIDLLKRDGFELGGSYTDCGLLIYDREIQDVHAGGSGCGCSASVLCSHVLNNMRAGNYKNVLFMSTGALMSPTSTQQGESIPSIAHLVHLTTVK